jgi:radial spoke head protein 4/6
MLLQKSINALIAKSGASSMRFWGKIKGTQMDYFVVEATQEGGAEPEEGAEAGEARGTGANQYVYWVTNSPVKDWTMLPDIKPSQIIKARQIKYMLSGNLSQKIITNPFYFDEERVYLRA